MRLPQPLLDSQFFLFERLDDLLRALGSEVERDEKVEIMRLAQLGLPPATSVLSVATMLGMNPGFVWSLMYKSQRHYRHFTIPKGRGFRQIDAPKVGLKIVQKWLSVQLGRIYQAPAHVHGFVPGKSHVTAAEAHLGAEWVASFDIQDFFPSTPKILVETVLMEAGYSPASAAVVASLCCHADRLVQGSPTSPVIANMCFASVDQKVAAFAAASGLKVTRYADDVTFSGKGDWNLAVERELLALLADSPWVLSRHKTQFARLPERLKVHGLLVDGEKIRLTKGYRNRLRMFTYLKKKGAQLGDSELSIKGHLNYAKFIEGRD